MLLIGLFVIGLALVGQSVEAQTVAGRQREFSKADFRRGGT
jgi:hypothetical protein